MIKIIFSSHVVWLKYIYDESKINSPTNYSIETERNNSKGNE
jgi:hypothetical protein